MVAGVLAGNGILGWVDGAPDRARFSEPFGVAVAADRTVFVSDAGDSHRIRRISPRGDVTTFTGGGAGFVDGAAERARFSTPSGLALDANGTLYVADSGNHAVRRVTPDGHVNTLAGDGLAGYVDGPVGRARLNGPVGVAVDAAGRVIVADTYNDRIRIVDRDGQVRTLAGGDEPGHVDGTAFEARFDTPCGVAVDAAGRIIVADTGNGLLRIIAPDGQVTSLAPVVGVEHPIAIAAAIDGGLYVADEGGTIVLLSPQGEPRLLAGGPPGFANGKGSEARFRRPSGLAVVGPDADRLAPTFVGDGLVRRAWPSASGSSHSRGSARSADREAAAPFRPLPPLEVVIADAGNAVVRRLRPAVAGGSSVLPWSNDLLEGVALPSSPRVFPAFDCDAFGRTPLLWPVAPLDGPHEVAGTFAEARGEPGQERFHAGVDVREVQGTPVRAVRDGIVASPISTGAFDTLNEWLRIGPVTYVHIRAGRIADPFGRGASLRRPRAPDRAASRGPGGSDGTMSKAAGRMPKADSQGPKAEIDLQRFAPVFDEAGALVRMRVKRGTRFATGDLVGSINAFNHVHLNVGWPGEEQNPLRFRLLRFEDHIAPTIAAHGVRLFDESWQPLNPDRVIAAPTRRRPRRTRSLPPTEPVTVRGRVHVVVDAWDQADGNTPSRRLGLYALGYQVLDRSGVPVDGFERPRDTIRFDAMRRDQDAAKQVFASGSGIPVYGANRTQFLYVVTTAFRDGIATPGYWDTTALAPGEYVLRVSAADYSDNRTTRDVKVTVTR